MEEYDITPMIQVLQWMYTGDYDLAQEEIDAVLAKLETVGGSRKRKRKCLYISRDGKS